jgi:hypothetical protein
MKYISQYLILFLSAIFLTACGAGQATEDISLEMEQDVEAESVSIEAS